MGKKKTFIIGTEWAEQMLGVPDEDFTTVVRAVFEYAVYGSHDEVSGLAKILVKQMADFIDDNTEKYNDVCQKRKEAVEKRWANAKQNDTNVYKCIQKNTNEYKSIHKHYDNMIYDNDNDRDNKTFVPSEKGLKEKDANASQKESAAEEKISKTDLEEIVARWNHLPEVVPKIVKLKSGTKRYESLKARVDDYGIDNIMLAIEKVNKSDFLCSGHKWFNFEWFVLPNNFPKVIEGHYDNDGVKQQKPSRAISVIQEMIDKGLIPNDD